MLIVPGKQIRHFFSQAFTLNLSSKFHWLMSSSQFTQYSHKARHLVLGKSLYCFLCFALNITNMMILPKRGLFALWLKNVLVSTSVISLGSLRIFLKWVHKELTSKLFFSNLNSTSQKSYGASENIYKGFKNFGSKILFLFSWKQKHHSK